MSKKNPTRPERWAAAAAKTNEGLTDLLAIQREYQDWQDNQPDSLDMEPVSEKLDAVCNINLKGVQSMVQEAIDADLPLGFGRD